MHHRSGSSLISGHEGEPEQIADVGTRDQFFRKWRALAVQFARYDSRASAARLIEDLLADVERIEIREQDAPLSLTEAARESGFSADHLGRLVRAGHLRNAGRKGAPRIRRCDLPRRTGTVGPQQRVGINREQIARDAIAPFTGERNG